MFANTQLMGTDMGYPDVCLTPAPPAPAPVPIPYPNVAMGPMAIPTAPNIMFMGTPAHNMTTTIPQTNGDNVGVATGVASGMVMGPARHVTPSTCTFVGGVPATKMTSVAIQNSTNCPGCRLVPSQVKVLLLT